MPGDNPLCLATTVIGSSGSNVYWTSSACTLEETFHPRKPFMRLIVALCALMSSSLAFATGARMFQNFTNDAGGWYAAADSNSTWSVTAGTAPNGYYGNDTKSSGTAESIAVYTLSTNPRNWQDNFIYSFDIYSSSGTTADQLGAVFDYIGPGNYYEVLVNVQGNVTVRHVHDGEVWSASGSVTGFSANTWAHVQLTLFNGSLSLKVNGNDTTFYNGTSNLGVSTVGGRIGLVARNELARFDNVNIVERIFRGNFTDDATKAAFATPQEPTTACSTNTKSELSCYFVLSGKDTSGYTWPIQMWDNDVDPNDPNATGAAFQYIPHITSGTISHYLNVKIEHVAGHGGPPSDVLHQTIINPGETGNLTPQVPYVIHPGNQFDQQHDLFLRFWLEYPSGLDGTMPDGQHSWWQMPFQIRTVDKDNPTPLRVSLFAANTPTHDGKHCDESPNHPNDPPQGQWHWLIQGDDGAVDTSPVDPTTGEPTTPETPYWELCNSTAAVPMGQWFKVEIYFHRATSESATGRVWVAIAGREVLDYTVPAGTPDHGMYDKGIRVDRIMLPQMYGGAYWPREQYVDDLEIWNGFPPDASPDLP